MTSAHTTSTASSGEDPARVVGTARVVAIGTARMVAIGTARVVGRGMATYPNRSFRAFLTALVASQTGSAVSTLTIPLIAAVSLRASPAQMSLLVAAGTAPAFLIRVPAAAWSDSLVTRVPLMSMCNVVQGLVVGLVPLLWWFDVLTFHLLLGVVVVGSLLTAIYSSLSSPVLVEIVPTDHLISANGRITATRSVADITGPALGSALLALVAAPFVMLTDAVSFLMSALLLTQVRPRPGDACDSRTGGLSKRRSASAGSRGSGAMASELLRHPGMQVLITVAFVNGVLEPLMVLFLVHDLYLRPSPIGLLLGLGAVGGILGGLLVGRITSRWGPERCLTIGTVSMMGSIALLPLCTPGSTGAAGIVMYELAGSFGGTVAASVVFGAVQAAAPAGGVSRMMALAMVLVQVAAVVGAPVGGILATVVGASPQVALVDPPSGERERAGLEPTARS
jgi:predicted MFS family arabinose efflux permease